jgi:dipeptidyl aminopeptidase/acylaminoacyl peptidase
MSDLGTFYRNTDPWTAAEAYPKYGHPINDRELLDRLSPLLRVETHTAPLLLVHGGNDTNVPASESRQMFEALQQQLGGRVECLIFDEEGHAIVKRENRAVLVAAIGKWLAEAFAPATS